MPHIERLQIEIGKRIDRYFSYRRAKKLCVEISRGIASFESRFLKSRLNHV